MQKNIIISGASGFIGSALSQFFSYRGDKVIHIARSESKSKYESVLQSDFTKEYITNFNSEDTFVINLSGANIGAKKWSNAYKKEIIDSRVNTTERIVKVLENSGIQLINASAVGYYGDAGDRVLDERSPAGSGFLSEVCQKWEKAASSYPNLLIARFGVVLGKSGGAFEKMIAPFKLHAGGHIGSGKQWLPWIHIEDLVQLMAFAIDKHLRGVMNFVSPNPITYKQFAKAAGEVLKTHAVLNVPSLAIKMMMGEQAELVLNSQRVVPIAAVSEEFQYKFGNINDALIDLLK